jgi:hypothetical protein
VADDIDTETRLDRLERKLDELLAAGHTTAERHEEQHLDRPTSVQEMVQAELRKADSERAAQAEKDAAKSEQQTIREQIAALTEAKPVAPQPRRQKLMWGAR